MDRFRDDVRTALRQMRTKPGLAALAVLTLAMGIGANTAIFSVVHAVLLRELPFEEADRLVRIYSGAEGVEGTMSPPDFVDLREQTGAFEGMAATNVSTVTLTGSQGVERVAAAYVTPDFLRVLRVEVARGRGFEGTDRAVDDPRVVILGDGLWQRRYGGDPDIVGRQIEIDGELRTVVGIAPPTLDFPASTQLWLPMTFSAETLATQRGAHYLEVIARLDPGVSVAAATMEVQRVAAGLAELYPDTNENKTAVVVPLRESLVGSVRPALLLLLGAVGLVLLIACANVASLLLVGAMGRSREMAIRAALGAGRRRLVRQLLTESVLLAALGGAMGVLVAVWGRDLLLSMQPQELPRLEEIRLDPTLLAFAAAVTIVTGILCGLAPAVHTAGRFDLMLRLRDGPGTERGGRAGRRLGAGLVAAELALAVVLLAGAGVLARSFVQLQQVDPGFHAENALTFGVSLPDERYPDPGQSSRFFDELTERVAALPGVERVGAIFGLPVSPFTYTISLTEIDGAPPERDELFTQIRVVTPDYFRALGIPLVGGRTITAGDREGGPHAVVVNESAAELLWPGEDPIGRSVRVGTGMALGRGNLGGEVVGVVGDVRDLGPAQPPRPHVYVAHAQFPVDYMTVVVRTAGDPTALVPTIRAELAAVDPDVPMFQILTMEQVLAGAVAEPRFYTLLFLVFAACALLLAGGGTYGVMAHNVQQRTGEIGIRMALGARSPHVLRLIVRQAAGTATLGIGFGVLLASALVRTIEAMLFEVSPVDPLTFIAVPILLGGVALFAAYLPALRASRMDPLEALERQ